MDNIVYYLFLLKFKNKDIVKKALNAKRYYRLIHKENRRKIPDNIDIQWCKEMYISYNIPIYKIAMCYGISDVTLRKMFIKNNVTLKSHCCGINSQNKYFKKIDSFDKAYFLGLISADGSVNMSGNISIELTESDSYILDKFNIYGKFNIKKLIISHKEDIKPRKRIAIASVNMVNDLLKYGICPNKSHIDCTHIPQISKKFIKHFIRGYFDGDGIAYSDGKIGFCGSKTIVTNIRDFLVANCKMNNVSVTYNKSNHIYYCTWGALDSVKKFYRYIYKNCNDLYLIRKRNKIEKRLQAHNIAIY